MISSPDEDHQADDRQSSTLDFGRQSNRGVRNERRRNLDALILPTPLSIEGRMVQHAGRLHPLASGKESVVIRDYVDSYCAVSLKMHRSRIKAYRKMGHVIEESGNLFEGTPSRPPSVAREGFDVKVELLGDREFAVVAADPRPPIGAILKCRRTHKGLTALEVARRMGETRYG